MVNYIVPDDFPDIITAINAIPAGAVADILVRAGHWVLNPVPQWPPNQIIAKSSLTLHGEGIDKTIIEFTPAGAEPIRADMITSVGDVNDFTLADLTVTQHVVPDNAGSSCVYLREGIHRNIAFLRVKVTDAFGGGIAPGNCTNLRVEDCIAERVWTGIGLGDTSFADVLRNTVRNVAGDAIFPAGVCLSVNIDYNLIESVGDTAIDITSATGAAPHQAVKARHNIIKHGGIRVSNATDTQVLDNSIEHGWIDVDSGQGDPINTLVEDNRILTNQGAGIGFYGAHGAAVRRNRIDMLTPDAGVVQSGITAAVWGTAIFEDNVISNPADYGIDFGGWGLSGESNFTFTRNTILDFGKYGIYDNGQPIGNVTISENNIYSIKPTTLWGVFTQLTTNVWTIQDNGIHVKNLIGDLAVNAPSSIVSGNHDYIYVPIPTTINIQVVSGVNGSVSPSGSQTLAIGQSYQFVAMPNIGYVFDHWDLGGANLGSTNPISILATADMNGKTLTALFTLIPPVQISLNIRTTGNGVTNPTVGTQTFNVGDSIFFSAIPNAEQTFTKWALNGTTYTDNPLMLQITQDMNGKTLTAEFTGPAPMLAGIPIWVIPIALIGVSVLYLAGRKK